MLAVLPVHGVLFPGCRLEVTVNRPRLLELVEEAVREHQEIALVAQRNVSAQDVGTEDVYRVATAARVLNVSTRGSAGIALEVEGVRRVRLTDFVQKAPYLRARVTPLTETPSWPGLEKQAQALRKVGAQVLKLEDKGPEAEARLRGLSPGQLADVLAQLTVAPVGVKQRLLEETDLQARLKRTQALLGARKRALAGRGLPGRHLLAYGFVSGVLSVQIALTRPDWHDPMGGALHGALVVAGLSFLIELFRWLR